MAEDVITPIPETAPPAEVTLEQAVEQVFGKDPEAPAGKGTPVSPEPAGAKGQPDEPVTERVTAKIAAGLRAEKRAAEARRERQEFETTHKQASAALEQQRAAMAADLKRIEQFQAAKASPSKALEILGLDGKTFLTTLATENEPAAIAARAVSVEQTEREKLAAELAEVKKQLADKDRDATEQRLTADAVAAQRTFLDHVATKADAYPHTLEEFTPREIVKRGWELATEHAAAYHKKFGEYPSDEVIAEQLEKEAVQRAQEKADDAWRERIGKTAPPPRQGTSSGDTRATQLERGPSPRTLSSRQSSQRSNAPRPWSQEGADEESMRILNGAIK